MGSANVNGEVNVLTRRVGLDVVFVVFELEALAHPDVAGILPK